MTSESILDRNRAALAGVIAQSRIARLPRERVAIESLTATPEDAAVEMELALAGRVLYLRFLNRDDALPAFDRTPSFNVIYVANPEERQLDSAQTAALAWVVQRLARFDPGGLTLARPTTARPPRSLPVVAQELVARAWKRELFDRSMARLNGRGFKTERLVVVVAQDCEMNCAFCPTTDRVNLHLRPSGEEWQFDDLVYQLQRGRELGATSVDFGGNDVLRFPRVLDLLEAAGRAGYTELIAQSPGQILADRAFAEAIAGSPLTRVCLPIYGATAKIHDGITRKPGAFDRLCQAIDNALALGRPRVELHTIALETTVGQIEGLIAFCEERFHLPLQVTPLRSNRQGERNIVLDMASYTQLAPIAARHPEAFQNEFPPCVLPREAVRERLAHTPRAQEPPGPLNLYDLGLPDGCEDAAVAEERRPIYPPACEGCTAKFACRGVLGHYLDAFGDGELRPFGALDGGAASVG